MRFPLPGVTRGLAAILAGSLVAAAPAPDPPPCSAPEFRQFDFWIGDWEVHAPDGRLAGINRIETILGGCALQERWTGSGPGRGTSLNFFEPAAGRWNQVWIDNEGMVLRLGGGFRSGRMILEGEIPGGPGRPVRHRITWTPLDGGRIRQRWESSSDAGATWTTLFDGHYTRRPAP